MFYQHKFFGLKSFLCITISVKNEFKYLEESCEVMKFLKQKFSTLIAYVSMENGNQEAQAVNVRRKETITEML